MTTPFGESLAVTVQNRAPRVLHLIASNFFGGPERQIIGHALAVNPRRYQVIVTAFSERGQETELVRRARDAGLAAETIFIRHGYDPHAPRRIRELITRWGAEIVVTHGYRSNLLGRHAARACGIKHLAVSRGWTTENLKVRFYHWLDRKTLRNSDLVVCVSQEKKRELVAHRVPESRLVVICNAVGIADPSPQPSIDWRAKFGWDASSRLVISAGRLSSEKGPDVFLAAVPEIMSAIPRARFILFGDGPLASRLLAGIAHMGLDRVVRLAGHVDDLPRELAAFNLLVNPSRSEGLPNIVLEAMAAGLSVVATAVGGVPEIIVDRQTGRLVRPGDPKALAQAVCESLFTPEHPAQWTDQARETVRMRFSFATQARQYEIAYDRLLGISPSPT